MCAGCSARFKRKPVRCRPPLYSSEHLVAVQPCTYDLDCLSSRTFTAFIHAWHTAARVSCLLQVMKGADVKAAQQRADKEWRGGRSRDRCLLPLFLFLGQSSSTCTILPVPLPFSSSQSSSSSSSKVPSASNRQHPFPKIIISNGDSPGITVITPHLGGSGNQPLSTATDDQGYVIPHTAFQRSDVVVFRSYFVSDGHILLKEDGGVRVRANTEVCSRLNPQ